MHEVVDQVARQAAATLALYPTTEN
jgi:hypothetical protein